MKETRLIGTAQVLRKQPGQVRQKQNLETQKFQLKQFPKMLKTKGCELKLPEFFAHFVKGNFKSKAKLNDFFN